MGKDCLLLGLNSKVEFALWNLFYPSSNIKLDFGIPVESACIFYCGGVGH